MRLGINSPAGYGFYVKLTPMSIVEPRLLKIWRYVYTALPGVMRYISSGQDARTTRVS
jgi:hypothetical protein